MKYNIELVNCNGHHLQAVKKLRELTDFKWGFAEAKHCIDSAPVIIFEDVDENTANEIYGAFQQIGVSINLIETEVSAPAPYIPEIHTTNIQPNNANYGNDREVLINLWCSYNEYNQAIDTANSDIEKRKKEISDLELDIKKMQDEIDKNKRIKATNGECLRPKYQRLSLFEFPDFDILKWIFVGLAVCYFVIMLIMVAVSPDTVEIWAEKLDFNAGAMIWFGTPVAGLVGSVLFALGYVIWYAVDTQKMNNARKWKSKNFDTTKAKNEAFKFLENLDGFVAEKSKKETAVSEHKNHILDLENYKRSLPIVQNNIPMPIELRSAEGVALLIQYIDTGRAYTLQESVNLYYQDVKDAKKMEELKKQTAYAQEQMINSRITAENSRITAENSYKTLEEQRRQRQALERGADAAQESADWARRSFFNDIYNQSK